MVEPHEREIREYLVRWSLLLLVAVLLAAGSKLFGFFASFPTPVVVAWAAIPLLSLLTAGLVGLSLERGFSTGEPRTNAFGKEVPKYKSKYHRSLAVIAFIVSLFVAVFLYSAIFGWLVDMTRIL